MEKTKNPGCLLGYYPDGTHENCSCDVCHKCGWNPKVEQERKRVNRRKYGNMKVTWTYGGE